MFRQLMVSTFPGRRQPMKPRHHQRSGEGYVSLERARHLFGRSEKAAAVALPAAQHRSRSPANSSAVVLLAAVLALTAGTARGGPGPLMREGEDENTVHDSCVALADSNPTQGLERAKAWRSEGGGFAADHCAAMALYDLGRYDEAAQGFEELAAAMMAMPKPQRARTLAQAGQSRLAGDDPRRAKADFDAALALNGDDPDLLMDRAEAFAALKQYWDAIDDLNRAVELAPERADAYIYRGSAYRSLDALDLALEDVERGLAIEPDSVLGLLERGNTRRLKGDAEGARADWLRVVELAPATPAAAAAQVNLDRLGAKSASADTAPPKKP
jgi:tetratricopeptide (TPR) repeat protein